MSTSLATAPCTTPVAFLHPYTPYPVQIQLMQQIWHVCEVGEQNIGIFESPTGTGKTLSLISAVLHWLTAHYPICPHRYSTAAASPAADPTLPSWVAEQVVEQQNNKASESEQQYADMKRNVKHHSHLLNKRVTQSEHAAIYNDLKQSIVRESELSDNGRRTDEDADLVVDWSDGDTASVLTGTDAAKRMLHLLDSLRSSTSTSTHNGDDAEYTDDKLPTVKPKLIYTSRTHSQLIQFIDELRKTDYIDKIRLVSLASRKQLCVNPIVNTTERSAAGVNDRCADLLNSKSTTAAPPSVKRAKTTHRHVTSGCPYNDRSAVKLIRDYTLTDVRDIEQLAALGNKLNACAYYGSRAAIPGAHVIVLPYQSLLSESTRQTLGIDVTDCIVVIDEAHNLIESINDLHSITVTLQTLQVVHSQLTQYYSKFEKRFKPGNATLLQQLIAFVHQCVHVIQTYQPETATDQTHVMTSNEFIHRMTDPTVLTLNPYTLSKFITESHLNHKLASYYDKYMITDADTVGIHTGVSDGTTSESTTRQGHGLTQINQLLLAVHQRATDGRVTISRAQPCSVRYMSLNPAVAFDSIRTTARNVLLLGGTMKPFNFLTQQLFNQHDATKIHTCAVGHVVASSSVLCCTLPSGPSNKLFDFTLKNRNDTSMISELGRTVLNICAVVPAGVVLFFVSHAYQRMVLEQWKIDGVYSKIGARKKVFSSDRDSIGDTLLRDYTHHITAGHGGVLCSVVGGKLSEGINFSDALCRCVILCGLPYPNAHDGELKEKMSYMSQFQPNGGQLYYETLCWRAVNQTIGRAVRHMKDYSVIVLCDIRYNRAGELTGLSGWLESSVMKCHGFGQMYGAVKQFFARRQIQPAI